MKRTWVEKNPYNKKEQLTDKFCDCTIDGLCVRLGIISKWEKADSIEKLIYNTYLKEDAEKIIYAFNLYMKYNKSEYAVVA